MPCAVSCRAILCDGQSRHERSEEYTASEAIPNFVRSIDLDDGSRSVFFDCDAPPTWKIVEASDHQPNGYFWEGVARWLISRGLAPAVSMDPESGMFSAQGAPAELDAFLIAIAPYLVEDDRMTALIRQADAAGHDFDD